MKAKQDRERVDIVDENCNVLYSVLKTEAHEKGLLHRTVIAGVRSSKGEIMLVAQAADRQEPGQYVSPMGGHVSAGETDEQALRREIEEELGYTEFEYKQVGKLIFNRSILNRQENHLFIVYEVLTDKNPNLGPEGDSFRWFSEQELRTELKEKPERFGASYFFLLEKLYPHLLK